MFGIVYYQETRNYDATNENDYYYIAFLSISYLHLLDIILLLSYVLFFHSGLNLNSRRILETKLPWESKFSKDKKMKLCKISIQLLRCFYFVPFVFYLLPFSRVPFNRGALFLIYRVPHNALSDFGSLECQQKISMGLKTWFVHVL